MNYYGHDDNKIDVVEKIMSLVGKRQYANALEFIDNLDSGDIDNPLILMSKAQCYLRLDMKKEAYDTYKETIILCNEKLNVENDPFVLNIKGNCNLILKNYIKKKNYNLPVGSIQLVQVKIATIGQAPL